MTTATLTRSGMNFVDTLLGLPARRATLSSNNKM
jgi:hypothetical protein